MIIIKFEKDWYNKCKDFANEQVKGSYNLYRLRGEYSSKKIVQDIINGKLGELAIHKLFKDKFSNVGVPDFEIYENKRKTYDADINVGSMKFHIKSQGAESKKRYGSSWLMQKGDKLWIKNDKNDFLIFLNIYKDHAELLGIIKVSDILKYNLLEECKVPRYRTTKVALYWDSITKKIKKLIQLKEINDEN